MALEQSDKCVRKLEISEKFKTLISPLKSSEKKQLEKNLIKDGCRDPIITWNGMIIDGHNRYEICTRLNIPFEVQEKEFDCEEAVIAWICANQLGRRNLNEESRRFLIGLQYESEKIANNLKNRDGHNQYTGSRRNLKPGEEESRPPVHVTKSFTADRIARANHIAHSTVEKYAIYTRALETIKRKVPELVQRILAGSFKISHENVVDLASKSKEEIMEYYMRLEKECDEFLPYKKTRKEISRRKVYPPRIKDKRSILPSVKDMPKYDPDGDVTGLTLTIPSWCSSIERIRNHTDLSAVSQEALSRLKEELQGLQKHIEDMLDDVRRL